MSTIEGVASEGVAISSRFFRIMEEEDMMMNRTNRTGDCYPTFYDDTKCEIILGIRRVVAVFSMISCLFVISVIIIFKKYRFLSQRLILYLSMAAFIQALVYGTGDFHISGRATQGIHTGLCIFQGYWTLFFDWLSFILVLCISFNVLWSSLFLKKTEKFEKFYILIALILPIIICCFPFIGSSYGPAGLWCWISSVRDGELYTTGIILQFVLFYGPLWTLSIIMLIAVISVLVILHRRKRKSVGRLDVSVETVTQQQLWEEEIRPIIFFPIVYIVIIFFPSINRLRLAGMYYAPESGANFFFWFMHSITLTLHGTVYAFLFGCDKQTLSRLRWAHIKAALKSHVKETTQEYPLTTNIRRETVYNKVKN